MFLSLMIPLVYLLNSRARVSEEKKKEKKKKTEKVKQKDIRIQYKTCPPSDELLWMDTYGTIPPEVKPWPYDEADIDNIMRKKLPKTVDEYYSYNTESKRSKEFADLCIPVKKVKSNFRDDKPVYRVTDPYESRPETEEDQQRRAAWNNYQMDYHGKDSSDNIIDMITNTLHEPQYHPHTYLPYNEPSYMPLVPGLHPFHNKQQNN